MFGMTSLPIETFEPFLHCEKLLLQLLHLLVISRGLAGAGWICAFGSS
jgi:hypothetical protein